MIIHQLGQSFSYSCPPHGPNYGASYHWLSRDGTAFKRDAHRAITPDGQLFIMYVTQRDINEITSLKGIACTIIGANQVYFAGSLMLEKRTAGRKSSLIYKFQQYIQKRIIMNPYLEHGYLLLGSCPKHPYAEGTGNVKAYVYDEGVRFSLAYCNYIIQTHENTIKLGTEMNTTKEMSEIVVQPGIEPGPPDY